MTDCQHGEVFDAVVIGTGFAGAVTAARLVQAGKRICVLERGRKFEPDDFPMYPKSDSLQRIDGGLADDREAPDLARWFWSIDQGLYDFRDLEDVVSVQAAGYGGGSLIYANVHLRPPPEVFERRWPRVYQRKYLDRFYDLAACMLDVRPMPKRVAKTEQLKRAADELRRGRDWFRPPLAVRFDAAGKNEWGRQQGQCDMRGQCWLGCRAQAKNSLDLNYLAIVEDARGDTGQPLADIRTLAEARRIERTTCVCGARFVVHWQDRLVHETGVRPGRNNSGQCAANHVFLCAGAVNSTELLLRSEGLLEPDISERVGSRYHPNADSIATVFDCDQPQESDFGPTITSALLYDGVRAGAHEHWVLDFKTCKPGDADLASELERDAVICCGGAELRLVQAPTFDFCTADGAGSPGVLVVAGDGGACRKDAVLTVGKSGAAFARLISDARPPEDWFLVEDGGYPTDIEPLLGIMRSPLWVRRNRYREEPVEPADAAPDPEVGWEAMRATQQVAMAAGRPRFPLSTALAAFRGMAKRSVNVPAVSSDEPKTLHVTDLFLGKAPTELEPLKNSIEYLFPPWLLNALAKDRTDAAKALAPIVDLFIDKLLDRLATQLDRRVNIESLARTFGEGLAAEIGQLKEGNKHMLIRGLMRQGIQALWGNEGVLAQRVNDLLLQQLPKDPAGWADFLAPLLGWLMQYRAGNGRTAVLLIMGRDQFRGRLRLDQAAGGKLVAELPAPLAVSARLAQEGLLRDIAKAWRGELRTNPAWTFFRRRITVHSQGGCPMTPDKLTRVTKYSGEVVGCPGLYVMDAAAFPTEVGVNPSATIVAVAEYKVARFIRKELRDRNFVRKPLDNEVATWMQRHGATLDPIARRPQRTSPAPATPPLGLTFSEVMTGFQALKPSTDPAVNWSNLNIGDAEIVSFDAGERRGVASDPIKVELTATIDDLGRFLVIQRQGAAQKIRLNGTVTIGSHVAYNVSPEKSYLQFFLRTSAARGSGGQDKRFFRYRIVFDRDGREHVIEAAKVLFDDPRLDIWYDLSTLYFDMFDGNPNGQEPIYRGIMRLAPDYFIERQLRSVAITPEEADPSRKSWAYFAFARYYAGEVTKIYFRNPDLVKDFLRNVIAADGN